MIACTDEEPYDHPFSETAEYSVVHTMVLVVVETVIDRSPWDPMVNPWHMQKRSIGRGQNDVGFFCVRFGVCPVSSCPILSQQKSDSR
jgi:hypothetical protein